MQNRIGLAPNVKHSTTTTRTPVIPMPGRLPVTRRVRSLPGRGIRIETPLDKVDTDTMVTAVGTISAVRYLDNKVFGRTMIVLTAEDGNSAHVLFNADSAYYAEPVLRKGSRIELHGLVTRHIPGQPVGLEGLGVRMVSA
jgi:hypothetical protein